MYNRYNNAVEFNGKADDVLEVLAWFKELIYDKGAGWQMGGEKFSNISFLGDGRIWFESDGDSGPEILREIAEEFRVGFVHYFGKNSYYGEAVFSQGKLHITVLDEDDLGSIGYDETSMSYTVGSGLLQTTGVQSTIFWRKRSWKTSPDRTRVITTVVKSDSFPQNLFLIVRSFECASSPDHLHLTNEISTFNY